MGKNKNKPNPGSNGHVNAGAAGLCNIKYGFESLPKNSLDKDIQYHGHSGASNGFFSRPPKKINVFAVTSVRIAGGRNSCGLSYTVGAENAALFPPGLINGTGSDRAFPIKSAAQAIYDGSAHTGFLFHDYFKLVGVAVDDVATDELGDNYSITPEPGKNWIAPTNGWMCKSGVPIHHIPSDFRTIPQRKLADHLDAKRRFEHQIAVAAKTAGADIILCENLGVNLEFLPFGEYKGRILNIRPAYDYHPSHELTTTNQAIDNAMAAAHCKGAKDTKIGAVMHFVTDGKGNGPVIADSKSTPVAPADKPLDIRRLNQALSMAQVAKFGMAHLADNWAGMTAAVDKICAAQQPHIIEIKSRRVPVVNLVPNTPLFVGVSTVARDRVK